MCIKFIKLEEMLAHPAEVYFTKFNNHKCKRTVNSLQSPIVEPIQYIRLV